MSNDKKRQAIAKQQYELNKLHMNNPFMQKKLFEDLHQIKQQLDELASRQSGHSTKLRPASGTLQTNSLLDEQVPGEVSSIYPNGNNDNDLDSYVNTAQRAVENRFLRDYSDELMGQQQFNKLMSQQNVVGPRGPYAEVADLDESYNSVKWLQLAQANSQDQENEFNTRLGQLPVSIIFAVIIKICARSLEPMLPNTCKLTFKINRTSLSPSYRPNSRRLQNSLRKT